MTQVVFFGFVEIALNLYGIINDFSNRSKLKRAVSFDTGDFSFRPNIEKLNCFDGLKFFLGFNLGMNCAEKFLGPI